MKKLLLLITVFFTIVFTGQAQRRVILHHQGTASMYNTISTAITASAAGDTIYISAGNFIENLHINKELTIFGAGHHPSTTAATGITEVSGAIYVRAGAIKGKIEGVYCDDIDMAGYNASDLTGYTISRCNMRNITLPTTITFSSSFIVSECIFRGNININNCTTYIFEKNIISTGYVQNAKFGLFSNNIFLHGAVNYLCYYCAECTLESNIIYYNGTTTADLLRNCNNISLHKNLIISDYDYQTNPIADNTFTSNQIVAASNGASVFTSWDGTTTIYAYDFDLHLLTPYDAINGDDGTQIGIYGTKDNLDNPTPYKDNCAPVIPLIEEKTISRTTNTDGDLPIQFKISAQNR
ncbi:MULTISPECIES: hypothetical protein [Labilibaculum]|uniref:Right handed beta helix domain-containing protein n=1 Tax=Labilibaculum euxinus TaxID=2686357 RepID=A0A7M4DA65_9BACT|nr:MULTISPECIES: hypothetical protein [Labilibaculum]MBN2597275.1 hypothetical protein [Marinifilaceae bacterium]MUP39544.1 hypothetical protein [Labilibaculum euxinus]MVB08749.1 hypothetical protein [Labilibaculum euxinus]